MSLPAHEGDRPAVHDPPPARTRRLPALPDRQRAGRVAAKLLFESALIIFSVLVALTANAWIERRAERDRIEEARRAFAEELRHNRDLLQEEMYHPYHVGMHDLYRALTGADEGERVALEQRFTEDFNTGFHPTPLRDAVWRSLSSGSVFERMDADEVVLLADIYHEQESLDVMFRTMFAIWMQPRADADNPALMRDEERKTASFLNDMISSEARLLDRYAEALAALDAPVR